MSDVAVGQTSGAGRILFVAALPDRMSVFALRGELVEEIGSVAVAEPRAVAVGNFVGDRAEDLTVAGAGGAVRALP